MAGQIDVRSSKHVITNRLTGVTLALIGRTLL
jgi:hypothetical protein